MRRFGIFVTMLAAFGLMVGMSGQAAFAKTYRVFFASYFAPSHPNTKTMEIFKELVEKNSNGDIKVALKPNNEAGGEEKIMELVKRGTLQIVMVGGLVKDDEPLFAAWEQPFIFDSWDHARKTFFSDGIKKFEGDYTKKTGVLIKGYVVNGFRQVSCNFPLTSMADLGKMKIRTPLNDIFVETFKSLGTNPTPLPMTELYTALETKVVDGQDNPYSTVKGMGWWEVQKHMLETRHIFSPTFVLVNGKFYNELPDNLKIVFDDAMAEAVKQNWDLSIEDENAAKEFMTSKGVNIVVPDDAFKQQMRDACKAVYTTLDGKIAGAKDFRDYVSSMK